MCIIIFAPFKGIYTQPLFCEIIDNLTINFCRLPAHIGAGTKHLTRNGKILSTGVYYYVIDLRNGKDKRSGSVTILK